MLRKRIVNVLCIAVYGGGVLAHGAEPPAQPKSPEAAPSAKARVEFSFGGDTPFNSTDSRGKYLAIHLLTGSAGDLAFLEECAKGERELAGFNQIFVLRQPAASLSSLKSEAPRQIVDRLFADDDGSLAATLHLATTPAGNAPGQFPVAVVLNTDGAELFRHTGVSSTDYLRFSKLAAEISARSRDTQTREANAANAVALQGYDPVAYFTGNQANAGSSTIVSSYHGLTYRFASDANRDLFNAEPAKYLPAYGGWCATAMAKGDKVEVDPQNFKVTGGRLFLFYKGLWGDARKDWLKDEPGLTAKADGHWNSRTAGK